MSTATIKRGAVPHRPGSLGRLREIREARHLSQHDLADMAGVATLSVSRAENGRMPASDTTFKIAAALEIEPGELYTRVEGVNA